MPWNGCLGAATRGDRFLGFPMAKQERMRVAILLWGVRYGLELGAGLGLAANGERVR